mmetsp:Transcript_55899/g.76281  ORF Transcript_55899/g.76281 Transcript_55899/m.76281 type:complete len:187 (+) Transcript_55899:106-666(+)
MLEPASVDILVFSDRDVFGDRKLQLEDALSEANVFFGSLIFDFDQIGWLNERIAGVETRFVFESALELMSATRVSQLSWTLFIITLTTLHSLTTLTSFTHSLHYPLHSLTSLHSLASLRWLPCNTKNGYRHRVQRERSIVPRLFIVTCGGYRVRVRLGLVWAHEMSNITRFKNNRNEYKRSLIMLE